MIITKIFKHRMRSRHGVNSISELKLMVNSGIDYLKKMELELINLELEWTSCQLGSFASCSLDAAPFSPYLVRLANKRL